MIFQRDNDCLESISNALVKSENLQRKVPNILSLFVYDKFITEFLEKYNFFNNFFC